ncbi:hypothetical protein PR202_ga29306 [Eleusine coracana subsp. coracana]|uniref:S phase cyclin A-associated protein in the endoplasmic reticulum N-terminal domain-containing protein n=1 Tax=Eleusine coracana subsp. coracana TaxID=191504 RepID=A0AAV5DLS1_ELECO|nr:hypothetical protein PR202_ga29306 [Eleusine coracana subsp. coracana]
MGSDNGDVDDLGSGWLEVKKKHRSSSKFTLQRSPGGSSHKILNSLSRTRTNSDSSRWRDKPQCPPPSIKANFGADELGSRETTDVHAEDVGASDLNSGLNASASECVSERPEELLVEKTGEPPPKTGLADCVDPSTPHESSSHSDGLAKCPDISDHVKYSPKTESLCVLSNTPVKFGDFDEVLSISVPSDASQDNSSSRHYRHDKDAAQFRNELKHESEHIVEINSWIKVDGTSLDVVNGVKTLNDDKSVLLDTHDILDNTLDVSCSTTSTDSVSLSCSNNDLEAPVTSSSVTSQESSTLFHGRAPASSDFGAETAESKERFRQRLWCFLFENLNRAVDELYLLCELECDMEQINESILVLEEAISDFQELKSRAEHLITPKNWLVCQRRGCQ